MATTQETFVIVGGGQAGAWALKTLRQGGFDGRLVLVGAETHPPYERPPLSKQFLSGETNRESTYVFPEKAYDELAIELRLGVQVTALDIPESRIEMGDGTALRYDRLLLATGGVPRTIALPGATLDNVLYLRSIEDSLALRNQLTPSNHLLIVGGGWIGLEVAATARKLGAKVTLVEYAPRLCSRVVPPAVSHLLYALHRDNGVEIVLNARLTALEGAGRVERARFADGQQLDVSAVIVGIGLQPSTQLADRAGLAVDNGIVVDDLWQTSHANLFAAGDVANFRTASGKRMRLESWDNAQKQGIAAANGMLGKSTKPDPFPWFWSDQYDRNIQLVGEFEDCDETIDLGENSPRSGTSLFLRRGQIVGVVAVNSGRNIRLVKRIMQSGQPIDVRMLAQSKLPLQEALKA